MFKKLLLIVSLALITISCQFTETLVLNEDGTGSIAMEMDFSEMMALSDAFSNDSSLVRTDSIIYMKDMLIEKKDSISKLPKAEQQKLKKLENFSFRTVMDPKSSKMFFTIATDFQKIDQANELMSAMENSGSFMQGTGSDVKVGSDDDSGGIVGVNYTFKKGKFKRDAYIRDETKHKAQIDSMKQAEAFMGGAIYRLKYTFPKKIKKVSVEDATFSLDGKTMEFERSMLEYMKDPDILDVEVELEN
jgi:hypothetical protein